MSSTYRLRAFATDRAAQTAVRRRRRAVTLLAAAASVVAIGFTRGLLAATVTWDGGTNGAGSTWLTGTNWNPDTTDLGPDANDVAEFSDFGTVGTIGINPNNPTNNGAANQAIGQILLSAGINRTINNNSTTVDGVLTLNGVGGVMLSNTTHNGMLTITNGSSKALGLVLGSSGDFHAAAENGRITINSIISETGGPRALNKTGAGTLTLNGANTFTGDMTISQGTVSVATLADAGVAQPLGMASSAVVLGGATTTGTLLYTGPATTTNRSFSAGSQGGTLSHDNDITYTGTISGFAGPFYKDGAGTLLLSDTGRVDSLSMNIRGGTLRLDNAAVNSNDRIGNSTTLALFGGTLQFDGQRDIPTAEAVDQLFIGSNHNVIRTTVAGGSAGNASINFTGLSRSTAATLAFDIAAGVDVNFASATLSNGIIGGWATAGSDFATIDPGSGNVVPHASTVSNDPTLWNSHENVRMTASGALNSAGNVNSLQLADNAGAPVTLTLNGQLGLSSGGILATAVSGHTIDGPGSITSLGNELYVHVPTDGHTLNINTPLADNGAGNVNLITTGPGVTVLNAANTFNGYVQINSGTLQLGANGTLNGTFAANSVIVNTGGTFSIDGQTKTIGALSGSGAVTLGGGALTLGGNNASTTYAGVISGAGGSITKVGTGTLTLAGVNTYTGGTNIGDPNGIDPGGVVTGNADSRFGDVASPINIYNGTLRLADGTAATSLITSGGPAGTVGVQLNIARGVTLNAGDPRIEVPDAQYAEIAGTISGAGALHKIGGGILDLRTATNTYAGGTIIEGGTLGVNKDANFGAANTPVEISNGGTIRWYSSGAAAQAGLAGRVLTVGAGGGAINWGLSSGVPRLENQIVSAVGNTLTKLGPNTVLSMNGLPGMDGDLNINQGRFNVQADGAAGDGTIHLTAADTGVANTSIAQLGIGQPPVPTGGTAGGFVPVLTNNIVLAPAGGINSFEVLGNATNQNILTLNGVISGDGGLIKGRVGGTTGVLVLGGNNTYAGGTTVLLGTLEISDNANLGDAANGVTLGGSGAAATLKINGNVSAAGRDVTVASGGGIIDTNGFDATFGNVAGTANMIKNGAGQLTVNHVRGNTLTVNAGTLVMAPDSGPAGASRTAALTIGADARLDLKRNKLITDAAVGTWDGTTYTGVQGEVARAYDFGAWDLPGLMTSEEDAGPNVGRATIGVATGEQALFLTPTDTGLFGGQTVTGATTLAMYTWAGDVDLNGYVDAVDYGTIDNWIQFPGTTGYTNGDLNYDGVIDAVDYGIIDNGIQLQGAPIPINSASLASSASSASLSGVTGVPEPACGFAILAAAASLIGRRRRRSER